MYLSKTESGKWVFKHALESYFTQHRGWNDVIQYFQNDLKAIAADPNRLKRTRLVAESWLSKFKVKLNIIFKFNCDYGVKRIFALELLCKCENCT